MHIGFMAANRLATGCHQAGDRLASGWRQFQIGCLYIRGCQQAGNRLASGWRQFQLGTCMHIGFMAANRLATGSHQAGDTWSQFKFLKIWWPIPASWQPSVASLLTAYWQPVDSLLPACWQPVTSPTNGCQQAVNRLAKKHSS